MRQRMIRPEFFGSDSMAECSVEARLVFTSLWVNADDRGNLKLSPRRLCNFVFGCGERSMEEYMGMLAELEAVDSIRLYKVGETAYVNIPNFLVYQKINRPTESTIPKPKCKGPTHVLEGYLPKLTDGSLSAHGGLTLNK